MSTGSPCDPVFLPEKHQSYSPEKVRPGPGREAGLDHEARRNPGNVLQVKGPDSAALHPGYRSLKNCLAETSCG